MTYYITKNKDLAKLKEGQVVWIKRANHYTNHEWRKVVVTSELSEYSTSLHFVDYKTGRRDCLTFSEPNYDGHFQLEEFFDPDSSLCAAPKILPTKEITNGSYMRTKQTVNVLASQTELKSLSLFGRICVKLKCLTLLRHESSNSLKEYEHVSGFNLWNPIVWLFLSFAFVYSALGDGLREFSPRLFFKEALLPKFHPYNIQKVQIKWSDVF